MFTTANWEWLERMIRESTLLSCIVKGHSIPKLSFTTPAGREITIPAGSKLTIWLGE